MIKKRVFSQSNNFHTFIINNLTKKNKNMSIAIIFNKRNSKPWEKELGKLLPNELIEVYPNIKNKEDVEFAICWKPEKNVLKEFPNLKVIQSVGAAVDHITETQEIDDNIIISKIVDTYLTNDMFEYTLTAVMAFIKDVNYYSINKCKKDWKPKYYKRINDTKICILGLGEIGSYVGKKLAEIGFNINGWSKSKKDIKGINSFHGKENLYNAIENCDILVNILPVTEETKDILNYNLLSKLNEGGFLINIGRGEHLVEKDLLKLIDEEHLYGASLDVFRNEPLDADDKLWDYPTVTITPHIAGITNVESASKTISENYIRMQKDEDILHRVSLAKGY